MKAEFPDAGDLHDTYAEWLTAAESALHHLESGGVAVRRYTMDLDHFLGWCAARQVPADAESRSAYVAEMLRGETDNGMSSE
ncbi:MAG TPA: hypothetical protein VG271_12060 [Beijerinckiaceae bacterium]|nr:hypothetical protein [Beijerinckiaceae bacterium]